MRRTTHGGTLRPAIGLALAVALGGFGGGCGTAATPTPSAAGASAPASGFVRIEHGPRENAQIVITLPSGRHIYIDVMATAGSHGIGAIPLPAAQDILVTTVDGARVATSMGDLHEDASFVRSFPGRLLSHEDGEIALPDATIRSIPARHTDAEPMGTDHIVVVQAEGLRIVHLGDFGQTAFTPEQLAAIGRPDIAISQLWNVRSGIDEHNPLGIAQMNAIRPRLFVPSHTSIETLRQAVAAWPSASHRGALVISKAQLPEETTMLLLGADADVDGADLGIASKY